MKYSYGTNNYRNKQVMTSNKVNRKYNKHKYFIVMDIKYLFLTDLPIFNK